MNGTPRLRSAFPTTPATQQRMTSRFAPQNPPPATSSPLPTVPSGPQPAAVSTAPRIREDLIPFPTQRLYASAVYGLLVMFCLYDWWRLLEEETSSLWLFIKWTFIFFSYMFGLPMLRIPWLEWSTNMSSAAFGVHAILVGMLMFRIPLPYEATFLMFTKTLFDRELSISENSVNVGKILHNNSLIMGKQIINILPEGSATMNPDGFSYCVDGNQPSVVIPIRFNQTAPIHVELLRFDFDTNANETIVLSSKERRRKYEDKERTVSIVSYTAKKPGLYRLNKVIDESKLEVQRRMSDTLVVTCPKVTVSAPGSDRCIGDLSDLTMEIEGTAPLKIVYTRNANEKESTHYFQSIQPENFASPLLGSTRATTLVVPGSPDFFWARTQKIKVPLNESMAPSGVWIYSVDEIHDATGNIANFSAGADDGEHIYPKGRHLEHTLTVHERPAAQLTGCDTRNPLMVATGRATQLPVQYLYGMTRANPNKQPSLPSSDRGPHTLTWKFSPINTLTQTGDHGDSAVIEEYVAKDMQDMPRIRGAGLYTLIAVKSKHCEGEVKEPASCLLFNPPEPGLSITSEPINDKCAGSSIGLLVDLDLIGTPPFVVNYDIISKSGIHSESIQVSGLRSQLELKPREAGHFKYQFTSIDDAVYKGHQLDSKDLILEQDVKPPASARLRRPSRPIDACIEEPVVMEVLLSGEKPFVLEYELVHNGKREKVKVADIDATIFEIQTKSLNSGGEYSLALASVKDNSGCKIFLNSEVKFKVRHQRPKASFGHLEGKHKTVSIENKQVNLPLRLTGQPPWHVEYMNIHSGETYEANLVASNDAIKVKKAGVYELVSVEDNTCPGTVDSLASTFEVSWLPRPQIKFADTAALVPRNEKFVKREVCEGDIDAVEVNLSGYPPYHVEYEVWHRPAQGAKTVIRKNFDAALGSATISMDTTKPGILEYNFTALSDALYKHDRKNWDPLTLEQTVHRKPSARFSKPGQSYKYCKEELAGDEVIPITLEGVPPFQLEIDIKHQSSARPETLKIASIESNQYDFRIPHNVLSLGVHQVSIRKVRDSHGCQQKTEYGAPHVQVQVYDVPTIYPLESRTDYCVGERISYTLSGTAPFEVFYNFEGSSKKAKAPNTNFRRIAEKPGTFTITGVSDKASECKATTAHTKVIHEMPSVKISKGRRVEVDIHEGSEAEILFEFWGTPPFEFTYTRSTNAKRGHKSQVLETRHEVSYEHSKTIQSSQEGTYEVVAIKDKFCSFSTQPQEGKKGAQKMLQF